MMITIFVIGFIGLYILGTHGVTIGRPLQRILNMLSHNMTWSEGVSLSVDSDAILGKPTTEFFYGPENARDIPCDDCPMKDACEVSGKECVAFRNWASKGDFTDSDMTRLLR